MVDPGKVAAQSLRLLFRVFIDHVPFKRMQHGHQLKCKDAKTPRIGQAVDTRDTAHDFRRAELRRVNLLTAFPG